MILQIFILSLTIPTHSQVNLRDGGLEIESKALPVRSFYQSRSLLRGDLGLGWWLDFETRLEFFPDQTVLWHHGPRQRLFANAQSSKYGLWQLKCLESLCEIRHQQGSFYVFSSQGQLLSWQDTERNTFSILKMSPQNRPSIIRHLNKKLNYSLDRAPDSLYLTRMGSFRFSYGKEDQSDLLLSVAGPKTKEAYTYSPLSNLIRIRGRSEMTIKYNEDQDQVAELVGPDGCRVSLNYESLQKTHSLQLTTLRTRQCPSQPPMASTHVHDFIPNVREWVLIRSRVQWQNKIWEVQYDPNTQEVESFTSPRTRSNN